MLMILLPIYLFALSALGASCSDPSAKLSSVPSSTSLSLPLDQQHDSRCFTTPQTDYGPTVDLNGQPVRYGPKENTSYAPKTRTNSSDPVWGQPTIRFANGSSCCQHLSQVREYIDYLDETIVKYLSIRQQFVVEAGRFKASKQEVRAPPRAVGVVKNAQAIAQKVGLAPWVAQVSYTALLNSFVELELCLFDEDVAKKNFAPHP
ncbi:hypothetical protein O181_031035 [Austropuccinia psidii MF-1]|uniref:Chorismate mutase domain-containing protein n=1 Tax=Austropuccinia psidii MF-1 TaxID=1389203 RepID=A0A9Q3H6T5_9BASI|nr:hypothetical protein [Austropuccinia psidii MF-1]